MNGKKMKRLHLMSWPKWRVGLFSSGRRNTKRKKRNIESRKKNYSVADGTCNTLRLSKLITKYLICIIQKKSLVYLKIISSRT